MKRLLRSFALLWLILPGCGHEPPKEPDPNAGKHKLAETDVRVWRTYPLLLLVAVKHHVGPDTVGLLVNAFEQQLNATHIYYHTEPPWHSQLPDRYEDYQEDVGTVSEDVRFFATAGARYSLYPSVVADIITDFYLIGGSNRDYPDCRDNN